MWYHHPLIAFFYPSAWLSSTGTGRANFHPVQPQTNLQQVQTPKVIRRSMAPGPRAQKANTHPTQCQDTTTTIKQGRPVGGAMSFHRQEWQELMDNPWIIQRTQGYHLELIGTPPENYSVLSPRRSPEQIRVLEREVQDLPAKDAIEPTTKSGFFGPMTVVSQERQGGGIPLSTSESWMRSSQSLTSRWRISTVWGMLSRRMSTWER